MRTSHAEYPPVGGKPGSQHDDPMIICVDPGGVRADYSDSEGHVIRYVVQAPTAGRAVFVSEAAAFTWTGAAGNPAKGRTIWSAGRAEGDQFPPSKSFFMINHRVADLHSLLAALRGEGCEVLDRTDDSEHGKFGWVIDPEGNKVELWQPPDGQ